MKITNFFGTYYKYILIFLWVSPLTAMHQEEQKEEPMTLSNPSSPGRYLEILMNLHNDGPEGPVDKETRIRFYQELTTPVPLYLDPKENQPQLTLDKIPNNHLPCCCSTKRKTSDMVALADALAHFDQKESSSNLTVLLFLRELFWGLAPYLDVDSKRKLWGSQNDRQDLELRLQNSKRALLCLLSFFDMLPPKPNTFLAQFFSHMVTTPSGEKKGILFEAGRRHETKEILPIERLVSLHERDFDALDESITKREGEKFWEDPKKYDFLYPYFIGMMLNNLELYFTPKACHSVFAFSKACPPFALQDLLYWLYKVGVGLFIVKVFPSYKKKRCIVPLILLTSYLANPIYVWNFGKDRKYPAFFITSSLTSCLHTSVNIFSILFYKFYFEGIKDIFYRIDNSALLSRMKIIANLEQKIGDLEKAKEAIFTANQKMPKPISQIIYTYYEEKAHDLKDPSNEIAYAIAGNIQEYYESIPLTTTSSTCVHHWKKCCPPPLLLLLLFHIILFGGSFYKMISFIK